MIEVKLLQSLKALLPMDVIPACKMTVLMMELTEYHGMDVEEVKSDMFPVPEIARDLEDELKYHVKSFPHVPDLSRVLEECTPV